MCMLVKYNYLKGEKPTHKKYHNIKSISKWTQNLLLKIDKGSLIYKEF